MLTKRRSSLPENPDAVRMSFGDHLDELRSCLIRALLGLMVTTGLCLKFGNYIIFALTAPYVAAMRAEDLDAQMVQLAPTETFLEYFKIAVECGLVLAIPWVLYQAWRFVAVGLYPHERRVVRVLAPASVGLFAIGAAFMVTLVLAGLLKFLVSTATWFSVPGADARFFERMLSAHRPQTTQPVSAPLQVPVLNADPPQPRHGDVWINRPDGSLNVQLDGERYLVPLKRADRRQLVQPLFSVSEYLGFVTGMALAFGLGFQVPIVVIFLVLAGIVPSERFRSARRFVIVGFAVAAAILTPSPDISSMLLLLVPMVALFESGLLIARAVERRRAAAARDA
ncbi:MAG: twin-arginine translocase subunit TatC [Phycisphaerae bacterium]